MKEVVVGPEALLPIHLLAAGVSPANLAVARLMAPGSSLRAPLGSFYPSSPLLGAEGQFQNLLLGHRMVQPFPMSLSKVCMVLKSRHFLHLFSAVIKASS